MSEEQKQQEEAKNEVKQEAKVEVTPAEVKKEEAPKGVFAPAEEEIAKSSEPMKKEIHAEVIAEVKIEEPKKEETIETTIGGVSGVATTAPEADSAPVVTGVTETITEPEIPLAPEEIANEGSEMWSGDDAEDDLISENTVIIQQFFNDNNIKADARKLAQFLFEVGIF